MVRVGKYILFERSKRDNDTKEELSLVVLARANGAQEERIKHQAQEIEDLKNAITALEKRLNTLERPAIPAPNGEDLTERILNALQDQAMTSTELRKTIHAGQNKTHTALQSLLVNGTVSVRKEGKKKLYYTK